VINEDYDILDQKADEFNQYLELFGSFYNENEGYNTKERIKRSTAIESIDSTNN